MNSSGTATFTTGLGIRGNPVRHWRAPCGVVSAGSKMRSARQPARICGGAAEMPGGPPPGPKAPPPRYKLPRRENSHRLACAALPAMARCHPRQLPIERPRRRRASPNVIIPSRPQPRSVRIVPATAAAQRDGQVQRRPRRPYQASRRAAPAVSAQTLPPRKRGAQVAEVPRSPFVAMSLPLTAAPSGPRSAVAARPKENSAAGHVGERARPAGSDRLSTAPSAVYGKSTGRAGQHRRQRSRRGRRVYRAPNGPSKVQPLVENEPGTLSSTWRCQWAGGSSSPASAQGSLTRSSTAFIS